MRKFSRIITLSSYAALACSGILASAGCGASEHHADSDPVTLEIRFQDSEEAQPQSTSPLHLALATPGPTTHDQVAKVQVDISFASSGQPFFLNFDLTKLAPDVWRGSVPILPRNQQLRFAARALNSTGAV